MIHFKIFLSFCFAVSLGFAAEDGVKVPNPLVTTTTGKVRGNVLTSVSGRDFYSFRGIRYAEPPVGPLRFKDPLPIQSWDGIFDATKDGPLCPQPWNNSADIDEDCLRLNIFTHNLPSELNSKDLKPVIVWWHPGGYYSMSGHSGYFAGPEYFMNRDVILVTMNYRLGSLGFLATGTREAPGNAGLKDQVIALRWIKENIARFGGDPNAVTLLGYSAGSLSITLHMVSPMSRNLFHKAIVMSGSAIAQYEIPPEQLFLAKRQARILNCTEINISEMINCMRTKPYIDFGNSLGQMFWIGGLPVLLFKPVIEADFGQERFLVEDPTKAYQEGRFMRIPIISGIAKDEFLNIAYDVLGSANFSRDMDQNWEEYAPIVFHYEENTPRSRNISNTLRKEFLGTTALSFNNSMPGMGYLFADALIGFSVHRFVHLAAKFTKVYYYRFSYQGRWSYFMIDNKPVGVAHHDDTLYLFTGPFIAPTFTEDYPEHVTMQRLTTMWESFAYNGQTFKMMFSTAAVVFLAAICAMSEAQTEGDVIVTTKLGRILGKSMSSRLGKSFLAFRGVRYAKAPIGNLRFEAPVPVEKWTDLFDATGDGPMCPQRRRNTSDLSEDCLRLNVYTRELPPDPSIESLEKKPVIIYFHPGGFYSVSGQSKNFAGPQLLMDRDIVLVTANYRLSSLGFLATGTMVAPGNAGLKDQVLVMKWVQEHISRFGGDPDSVTLMGYSAGAMSVTLHMVSPMSKNLFHKAIVMSGSAASQFEIPNDQLNLAKKQARLLNCSENNVTELVECLKQKSMIDFVDTVGPMFEFGSGHPIILWSPVVEQDFGQERFLIEDPVKSYQEGRFMKIPVIAGITKDEFVGAAIGILEDDNLRHQLDSNFDTYAPICFLYERDTPLSQNITQELRKTFLGNQTLNLPNSIEGLGYLLSDGVIGFGMHRFVRLSSRNTTVWNYKFTYKGRYSHVYYPGDKPYGVVHHDDLLYLFAVPGIAPLFTQEDPEHVTVERLTRMWSHFALTGDPNKPNDEYLKGLNWTSFSYDKENYLDIGEELEMKQNLYTDRFAVWDRLFPLNWSGKHQHHQHHHHHEKQEGHHYHHH